jgi:hypothetical protein
VVGSASDLGVFGRPWRVCEGERRIRSETEQCGRVREAERIIQNRNSGRMENGDDIFNAKAVTKRRLRETT